MRSKSFLLTIILTVVWQFCVEAEASPRCESIFSRETAVSESQRLANKMLNDQPNFFETITPFNYEGREYLKVKFVDNISEITGGGFAGGLYGKNHPNFYQYNKIVPLLESYGIKVLSETHYIVPTPKTLKSLHKKLILAGAPHSFYEPVEVNGLISPQQYLTLLAQKKWPIDATGSKEYLHDLLVHWPGAATAPKTIVDLQTSIANVANDLLKHKELAKTDKARGALEQVTGDAVDSIDFLNTSFYLSHGLEGHKKQMSTAISGMLQKLGHHNDMLINWKSRVLLRQQGLSKYFDILWKVDSDSIDREIENAYQQRLEEL